MYLTDGGREREDSVTCTEFGRIPVHGSTRHKIFVVWEWDGVVCTRKV